MLSALASAVGVQKFLARRPQRQVDKSGGGGGQTIWGIIFLISGKTQAQFVGFQC